MLPRWHILWGAVFTLIIWYFAPGINPGYLALIFLSSILIDFDHYVNASVKNKSLHLWSAFEYYKKMAIQQKKERSRGIRKRGDFHLFHTIEFHLLIGAIGLYSTPFFYIFIGMVFHSLLDLFYLINKDYLYRREYFLFNWLAKKFD